MGVRLPAHPRRSIGKIVVLALFALVMGIACSNRAGTALSVDKLSARVEANADGQVAFETFLLGNTGSGDLQAKASVSSSDRGCDAVSIPVTALTVPAGQIVALQAVMGPLHTPGTYTCRITLQSNNSATSSRTLELHYAVAGPAVGQGSGPRLQVDKTAVDAGTVEYDQPLYESFTIRNVGDQPLVLSGQPQLRVLDGC